MQWVSSGVSVQISDSPSDSPYLRTRTERLKYLGGVCLASYGKENMPTPALRQAQAVKRKHPLRNLVPGALESRNGLSNHSGVVTGNGWNVLHENNKRLEYFCGSSHPTIKAIPLVCASSVVVQIRMPLARRSANQEIDTPDEFTYPLFPIGQAVSKVSVEEETNIA